MKQSTDILGEYADYLSDESRRTGCADRIVFAESEADIVAVLHEAAAQATPVTVQSGLTGITGGATPDGGLILNVSRMVCVPGMRYDEAAGRFFVRVQPGFTLKALHEALMHGGDFDTVGWTAESLAALARYRQGPPHVFPPDLTEAGACLAGVVANNGSGARTFRYGPARPHVSALRVVLPGGEVLALRRGEQYAHGREFRLTSENMRGEAHLRRKCATGSPLAPRARLDGESPLPVDCGCEATERTNEAALEPEVGCVFSGRLPDYHMPAVKNAAGLYAADDMDLIDLFIGSEGVLGVFSELELALTPLPAVAWGMTAFLPSEDAALALVERVRVEHREQVAAIEFFSAEALDLLRAQRSCNPAFAALPELKAHWHTAVYVELHGDTEAAVEQALAGTCEALADVGGDVDDTWLATSRREIETFKGVRHAVPEAVNLLIGERKRQYPGLTKLGTDLAVPDDCLREVMRMYHDDLRTAGLEYVIFGHIGNNHVHVNILPRTPEEYQHGKALYLEWAHRVVAMGGTVSAEHGIGKLKTAMLEIMYGPEAIEQMRAVKRVFDPQMLLNRGTLFAHSA
jgi:D-lactate dehydrogenase (cytochrome)